MSYKNKLTALCKGLNLKNVDNLLKRKESFFLNLGKALLLKMNTTKKEKDENN